MLTPSPKSGDIFELSLPKLRQSGHRHPAIFLRASTTHATFTFLSSEFSLCREGKDFPIRKEDEDVAEFSATGLTKSSYLIDSEVEFDVPLANFSGKYRGRISGNLKLRIEDWWGEPFK